MTGAVLSCAISIGFVIPSVGNLAASRSLRLVRAKLSPGKT